MGSLTVPLFIANAFIQGLIVNGAIYIAGGFIKEATTLKLSTKIYEDTIDFSDAENSNHSGTLYGTRYIVKEMGDYYQRTYSDGWVSTQWGTQNLASGIVSTLYGMTLTSQSRWF